MVHIYSISPDFVSSTRKHTQVAVESLNQTKIFFARVCLCVCVLTRFFTLERDCFICPLYLRLSIELLCPNIRFRRCRDNCSMAICLIEALVNSYRSVNISKVRTLFFFSLLNCTKAEVR